MKKEMKVSIVIPNYNGKHFMKACMESLYKQTWKEFEVIVVDNASSDGSVSYIEEYYPDIRLIKMDTNTGFSTAVNVGIQDAKAPYVFLLNNDTECEPNCVRELYHAIRKSKKIFSVSSQMIQYHNRESLDSAGDIYTVFGWAFNRGNGKPISMYSKEESVFTACAGAAMYRKSIFDEIGYFDENFFAYREDIDIGYRGRIHGYENRYCPTAKVYHIGSGTSGSKHNAFKVKLGVRNNIYLNYKNMPLPFLLINLPFLFIGYSVKWIYFIKKGLGKAYFEGVKEGFQKRKHLTKEKFQWKNLLNYIGIQIELYKNTWKIVKEKIKKD